MKNSTEGIGLGGILFVVFLVLKLTGNIDWSWWWVFAPFWIPIAVVFVMSLIFVLAAIISNR